MKNCIHKIVCSATAGLILLSACKKDEARISFQGGTAPALTSTVSDSISLPVTDTTRTAVTFSWTNPNYQFSNGISSMNVSYYLEFDTASGFNSSKLQTVGISANLSQTFSVAQLNAILANGMGLTTGSQHTVQVRVVSFMSPYTSTSQPIGTLASNTLSYSVTPYAPPPAVAPPKSGTLYIVGSAVADNWANPIPAGDLAGETFTMLSPTHFQLITNLVGGAEYKLIGVNGSWTDQWSVATADTYPNGGPFVYNGANCIAPSASGSYLIDVNFQTGKFTVTAH
ncbi:MAG TPA: SusE domain-containing protein [Puia sp.]|nr:SusE domain-containing protein [Puia sp.]